MKKTWTGNSGRKEKILKGVVISDAMDKTVIVKVSSRFRHPFIGKTVVSFKKYKTHDEDNSAKIGDIVEILNCRPISKMKHMRLYRIVNNEN